jgi:transcriptional regulator with XRE-family HTH domain
METLKELRMKYSLAKAAELLGVSPSALSLYESGKRNLSAEMIEKMASLYSVDENTIHAAYRNTKKVS